MDRIQCRNCEALQEPSDKCRRCGRTLPKPIIQTVEIVRVVEKVVPAIDLNKPFEEIERIVITQCIKRFNGNIAAAARSLHIDRATLYRKLRSYGLSQNATEKN